MVDDVNGTHHLPPEYFVQDGDTVSPEQHNPPFEDVSDALTNRLHKDGRTLWTGNQNANGQRLTGLADGVGLQDAATIKQAVASAAPIGAMLPYGGDTAPPNWLLCYGQAISRATYATLFGIFGTKYGAGDGSTTFNLPDWRGRSFFGLDNMGGTDANRVTTAGSGIDGKTLGAAGGAQSVTLAETQMPAHTHGASTESAGNHAHSGSTAGAGSHSHSGVTDVQGNHAHGGGTSVNGGHTHGYTTVSQQVFTWQLGSGNFALIPAASNTNAAGDHNHSIATDVQGAHQHGLAINGVGDHAHTLSTNTTGAHTHGVTVNSAGGGQAHNNMPPVIGFNVIVKVL